jgi:hypothetical protein
MKKSGNLKLPLIDFIFCFRSKFQGFTIRHLFSFVTVVDVITMTSSMEVVIDRSDVIKISQPIRSTRVDGIKPFPVVTEVAAK